MAEAPQTPLPQPCRQLSAHANAQVLNRVHCASSAQLMLEDAIVTQYPGKIALVSSFGAESAVLLHMVSQIAPETAVLFLETQMLFPETLAYQTRLSETLGLRDVRVIRPDPSDLAADDPGGTLHGENPDGCCFIRKTLPLRRAVTPFCAWITGRKRHQAATRTDLPLFEEDTETRRLKMNPLARWSAEDLRAYMDRHALPRHPLVARGFPSIGCAPCTTPVAAGENPRAGRWRGQEKSECGIHFDGTRWIRTPAPKGVIGSFN